MNTGTKDSVETKSSTSTCQKNFLMRRRKKHILAGEYTTEEWVEFNYIIGSKLKDFMLTLNTSIDIENPRETI